MNESRWEASRRSARNNFIVFSLVFIVAAAIAVIIFVNNRDQLRQASAPVVTSSGVPAGLPPDPVRDSTPDTVSVTQHHPSTDSSAQRPAAGNPAGKKELKPQPVPSAVRQPPAPPSAAVTPTPPAPVKKTVIKAASTPLPIGKSASRTAVEAVPPSAGVAIPPQPAPAAVKSGKTSPVERAGSPASIVLPPFPCSIDSRKDVVIYPSLELFFEDAERRSALLLRRDDIKVMVLKTLRTKEPGTIKTSVLEAELRDAINQLFDHNEIVTVKINDIRIEKAAK
jgi:flagellar basal body-associated protein FliL